MGAHTNTSNLCVPTQLNSHLRLLDTKIVLHTAFHIAGIVLFNVLVLAANSNFQSTQLDEG